MKKQTVCFFTLWAAACAGAPPAAGPVRPNVVLLLADDLGYGDVGCYGAPDVRTPNIDALAAGGVRLTQFYSGGPECTPTRTALLTGRYPQRPGGLECAIGIANVGRYDDAIRLRERRELGLPPSESVLARALKEAGYATAVCGKWHLGYERHFFPDRHGFDHSFGPLGGGVDYFFHTEPDGTPMLYLNGAPVRAEGYLTDLITEDAVRFIRSQRGRPFLLYVPFTAPHSPYQGPLDRRPHPLDATEWNRGDRSTFAAMVGRLDEGIGRILGALAEMGLEKETLVIFASDNGGDPRGRNEPFRGRKGGLFEGGIRVPCVLRWPGRLPEGAVTDRVGTTMDLTASILAAAGAKADRPLDGIDLAGDLARSAPPAARPLFWRARRGGETWRAAREGTLKYVSHQSPGKIEEFLFDLERDPAETANLASSRPDDRERLKVLLRAWEERVKPAR